MNAESPAEGEACREVGDSAQNDSLRARRRVRTPIPATSRLAYEQATEARWMIYRAILTLLAEHGPLVDDQLHRLYSLGPWPPRSRQYFATARSELRDAGKVRDTGRRGVSDMANPATLWERAPHGDDG